MQRTETKYVFDRLDVAALRRVLRRSCRPIIHAGPVSTVRSIYFDDPALGACRANLDGIGIRHKTRLRWYDREEPFGDAFYEIKWRRHRTCGKHRRRVALDETSFSAWRDELSRVLPTEEASHLSRDTEATVLVEYRREHFALRDTEARLTLDYDLCFYPQLGRRRPTRRFGERLPGVVLIECKTAPGDTASLQGVLAPLRAAPSRFSKYVVGCQRLGYLSGDY